MSTTGMSPIWSLTATDARVASRRLSNATKSLAAKSASRREVVYSASSSVSGLKTRMCTSGRDAHHGTSFEGEIASSPPEEARRIERAPRLGGARPLACGRATPRRGIARAQVSTHEVDMVAEDGRPRPCAATSHPKAKAPTRN